MTELTLERGSGDFLFARPSFLSGMGQVLDIAGTYPLYNSSLTPEQADAIALGMDWNSVGDDIRRAMEQYVTEHPELAINAR